MIEPPIKKDLMLKAIMSQARTIAEEYTRKEIDKAMEKIKEIAIAKAIISINERIGVFENRFDYGYINEVKIVLDMTTEASDE